MRQAGGIEITQRMLAAGRKAFWEHDVEEAGSEIVLREIFEAMLQAVDETAHSENGNDAVNEVGKRHERLD
jgi:cobalamin biosynthesis Mg chelatase CobN